MTWLGDEGNAGEVLSGCEHISLTGDQGSAKSWIEEVLLGDFPRCDFTHFRGGKTRFVFDPSWPLPWNRLLRRGRAHRQSCHRDVAVLDGRWLALAIQAGNESVLHLVGIAQNIALIKVENIGEVVHSGHHAVSDARLDDVFPFLPEDFPIADFF